jgi:hypothetical protein
MRAGPESSVAASRVSLREPMTRTDFDLDLLLIDVGVARVKPAEFVVFRIPHRRLLRDRRVMRALCLT